MTGARWQPARRVARLAAVAAVAAAAPSPGNASAAIRARYFAHGAAAGADAVDEAVAWLAAQEALAPPRANATAPAFSARDLPGAGGGRVCAVTHGRVAAEGTFERTGGAPPYDWSCWCLKARYHTAPACLGAAAVDRPVRWRWTLRSALAGACAMPDPHPSAVARSFLEHGAPSPASRRRRTMTVVMLGLSFMGQPFASLGCLYEASVVGGFVKHAVRDAGGAAADASVGAIRAGGGQCDGYDRDYLPTYFAEDVHPRPLDPPAPRSNFYRCDPNHALYEYGPPPGSRGPRARVCFQYLFNLKKLPRDSKPPCDLDWAEVDVVLHMFPNRALVDLYLPRAGNPASRPILVSVNEIYQTALERQLRDAYAAAGFDPPSHADLLARPRSCASPDVHYALPGFTDHAVRAWFALISTGLAGVPRGGLVGQLDKPR